MAVINNSINYIIPNNGKQVFISLTAGGGRSSDASDDFCGSGSGAGGSCSRLPFFSEVGNIEVKCIVGKGGNDDNPDGENTSVEIYVNETLQETYTVYGGKRGVLHEVSLGGSGMYNFHGMNGTPGTSNSPGIGGSSLHFPGTSRGKYGSGSIGATRENKKGINGGDGFIVLEWI